MTALVRSFQNAAFAQALRRVSALPNDATLEQIEEKLGRDGEDHIWLLLSTWEALAILLYRRELTIELIDDFLSDPIAVSRRKLSRYVEVKRAEAQRQTYFEWFQWLAERMMEREVKLPPVPAYIAHRNSA